MWTKQKFTNYKESGCLASNQHFSFKCFQQNVYVSKKKSKNRQASFGSSECKWVNSIFFHCLWKFGKNKIIWLWEFDKKNLLLKIQKKMICLFLKIGGVHLLKEKYRTISQPNNEAPSCIGKILPLSCTHRCV